MNLFDNRDELYNLIIAASESIGFSPAIIEKDYYSMLFLKKIIEYDNNIIFKGGTSLSKCYKLISRYSEDLDLTYSTKMSDSKRKKLKKFIKITAERLNMEISNIDETRSRRDFNRYLIDYVPMFSNSILKENIIVEIALQIYSFPYVEKECSSYIYEYLIRINREDLINLYELSPFTIKVQSLERTFIDKVFALCDYYLADRKERNSRHLYDLCKISEVINVNNLVDLISKVRVARKNNPSCLSCRDDISIKEIIERIVNEKYYKKDYESITINLLDENEAKKYSYDYVISYFETIKGF